MTIAASDIRDAVETLDGQVVRTPIVRPGGLTDALAADIFLKLETRQRTRSFKDRCAFVKLKQVAQEKNNGIIAISAGNHAQGVAYHAQRLGIAATIVMPKGTPFTKIARTQGSGAHVVLEADSVSDAKPYADEVADKVGLVLCIFTRIRISSADKKPSHWKRWLMYQV